MRPYSQPFKIGEIDFVLVKDHYGDFPKRKLATRLVIRTGVKYKLNGKGVREKKKSPW
jgi:hypothetical protein